MSSRFGWDAGDVDIVSRTRMAPHDTRGDVAGHPFYGNQWQYNGQNVATMTRAQLLNALQQTGYRGPTSYTVARLKQLTDAHLARVTPAPPTQQQQAQQSVQAAAAQTQPVTQAPPTPAATPAPTSGLTAKQVDTMSRTALVAALKANGYTGPTSYNMDRLRGIAHAQVTRLNAAAARAEATAAQKDNPPQDGYRIASDRTTDAAAVIDAKRDYAPEDPNYRHGDTTLAQLYQAQGFDGKPVVTSREDFDARKANGEFYTFTHMYTSFSGAPRWNNGETELHRGMSPGGTRTGVELAESFRTGSYYAGLGVYGNGTFASLDRNTAAQYAGAGAIVSFALRSDASVVSLGRLETEYRAWKQSDAGMRQWSDGAYDLAHFAVLKGYDAMTVDRKGDPGHVVVYNRTAVIVVEG